MFRDPAENTSTPTREEADELVDRIREWGTYADTVSALNASHFPQTQQSTIIACVILW